MRPEELRLEKLVRHAARLGFALPNGTDLCHVAGSFLSGCQDRAEAEAGPIRTQTAHKRWLNEPSPADYLEVLPEDVNLLPDFLGGCSVWTRPTGGLSFG